MPVKIDKPLTRETHTEIHPSWFGQPDSAKPRKLIITLDRGHLELREKGLRREPIRVPYEKLYRNAYWDSARSKAGI